MKEEDYLISSAINVGIDGRKGNLRSLGPWFWSASDENMYVQAFRTIVYDKKKRLFPVCPYKRS